MNVDQLRYVIEVAKVHSISAASQNMHVTLPTISQSISHLEAELGVKLFTRSRNGTVPTPEGIHLIRIASEIMDKINELKEEAQSYTHSLSGELRLATIPGPMSLLVKTIAAFKKDYPNIQVEISEQSSQDILNDIHHHKIDLGLIILYEDLQPSIGELNFAKVIEAKLQCCVSRNSALALRDSITPEDLRRYPLVLYKEDYILWFVDHLASRYGPFNVMFTSNNQEAIKGALREELALTLGLDYTFNHADSLLYKEFKLLAIDTPTNSLVPLGWVQHPNKSGSKIVKHFIRRLKMQFES
ncbi:LysR family transcriptional regulator [Paenibacillus planticolens]|uniref:LysR family transcriptional regulator n=1 Tax=Paenibacillus planticolens TaxID=2654976 RepID=A0ABX1ZNJ0_9BACL|nr:LysR family transcriptional regulator [Paenibacillus planticolens]NOV01660.1 LysR family transcriptional regulator [Paenibacillus planticolens]